MKKDKQKSDVLGEEEERVCCICEKAFRSGKALGGHMRSHVMKKKKKKKMDCEMMMKKCSECGKKFPSMKSLFGHMRCHPERDWRGINPPESLRGWPLTAKRRRNPNHRLRNAVNFLMTLASPQVEQIGGESVEQLKVLKKKKKRRKKVKLCDLNLLENDKNNHTNLLDFDLNEVPPSISSC
ncbi:uncharacterized protein LOC130986093 [Salvia miltiorrhiza]|uniref:uncharacterized protein LOC130986093 n=1 Tax=Salvia miltiorrhiza TaxID=226208 RepID=UPI0025AC7B4D|nr:uncharacterized protein LOC130986093 [Salvia miltiorrhiza]